MKLPLKWLKEYVDFNVTIDEFVERMASRGFEIASVDPELPVVTNVVVCRVVSIAQHENADRLKVCMVDIGAEEPVQIVTNATNLYEGALVPVALDGADLVGGIHITPTKMRGVKSFGMFCSGHELGINDAHYPGAGEDQVLIFREEHPAGQPIHEALGMDDVIFDIELTPNRADCQSIIGICREAAAALGQRFTEPTIKHVPGEGNEKDYASVTIKNSALCPRYTARVVVDLKIEPSPKWMQKKLLSVGLRPINNIVDITNYVLIEYGHPMHAFDLACVADGAIVVRNAEDNEHITTLDSKERVVDKDMLLIADPTKGVGIAGVMGGENSEITENTKAALFESAVFIASNIRSTTRKLRHVTDSAQRFMRGVEPHNAYLALERAVELVHELGAGRVIGEVIDVSTADLSPKNITVDCDRVNGIIGSDFTPEYMAELLGTINIPAKADGRSLHVSVPHFRTDIEDSIESTSDIAEEVARLHGYEKLTPTLMSGGMTSGYISDDFKLEDLIKDTMASLGAYEMYNYNFMSPSHLEWLLLDAGSEKRQAVKILNPFGEEQSLMRTTLVPGMLGTLALNAKRKTGHGRFFEVGNVHFDNNPDLPEERKMLGVAFMGSGDDFFALKGVLDELFDRLGVHGVRYTAGGSEYLCPGKKAVLTVDGDTLGEMGVLHPSAAKSFEVSQNTIVAEISFKMLRKHMTDGKQYSPIPKFPGADRDIAVVLDESVTSDEIVDVINSCKLNVTLTNLRLFDVYRGTGIPEGKKSMAYSFTLRRDDRTLTDADIAEAMNVIIAKLEKRLSAVLRS